MAAMVVYAAMEVVAVVAVVALVPIPVHRERTDNCSWRRRSNPKLGKLWAIHHALGKTGQAAWASSRSGGCLGGAGSPTQ